MNVKYIQEIVLDIVLRLFVSFMIIKLFSMVAEYIKTRIIDLGHSNITSEMRNKKKNAIYYELANIIYYFIILLGGIIAIINIGIQVPTIIAIVSIFGLAISLSFQGTLINIIEGIHISVNDRFDIGDTITLQEKTGTVKTLTLFNTTITDNNGGEIYIPNNLFQNFPVKNLSR